jgi:hypothetical protein
MNNIIPCPHCSIELKQDQDNLYCSKCGFLLSIEWICNTFRGLQENEILKDLKKLTSKSKVKPDKPFSHVIGGSGMYK